MSFADVFILRTLVAAAKKENDGGPVLSVIGAVSWTKMDAKLPNAAADITTISEIAVINAIQPFQNLSPARDIPKPVDPFLKRIGSIGSDIVEEFSFS